MLVNKTQLADVIGVSVRTITEWQKSLGFAIESSGARGSENTYDTVKVIQWMIAREVQKQESSSGNEQDATEKPRDRLDRLRADLVEVDLAERLNQLAPASLYERVWSDHIVAAKTELLSLPLRVVAEIHSLHGVTVDPDLILSLVEEALAKLEGFDVNIDTEQSTLAADDEVDRGEGD